MGQVVDSSVQGHKVDITIGLTSYSAPLWDETRQQFVDRLRSKLRQMPRYLLR